MYMFRYGCISHEMHTPWRHSYRLITRTVALLGKCIIGRAAIHPLSRSEPLSVTMRYFSWIETVACIYAALNIIMNRYR